MKKSILIGNGFTSQLINEYCDTNMKQKLIKYCCNDYKFINKLFDIFRIKDKTYTIKNRDYIINVLKEKKFQNYIDIFGKYFLQYNLINEVFNKEIGSVENLLKVIDLFEKIGKIDGEKKNEIEKIANKIYFNEGKYGLKDTNLTDYSKVKNFFKAFDYIFTTNYDLILDDICDNEDKVFHLHGGFNIEHRNLKTKKRLTDENSYIVWGINGDEKYKELSPGFVWSNFRWDAFRWGESLLADYFSILENNQYDELHVFGFSGENDQHINQRIVANKNIMIIYFYCKPERINDYEYQHKIKGLFKGTNADIVFEPWSKIWSYIR